jgi:hypothetical protein
MYKKDITVKCACLRCRKTFKKYKYKQNARGDWTELQNEFNCPECGSAMYEAGSAFKAPKEKDIKAWEKLKPFFESGYRFHNDMGSPFREKIETKPPKEEFTASEFRKPARKRRRA